MRLTGRTGPDGHRLDLRDMRPEKRRRAYVCWVDDDGDVSVDVVAVLHWAVLPATRGDDRRETWQPAFRYGGWWAVPEWWAESWPQRALVISDPGTTPDEALLVRSAEALVRRRVVFVPQSYTAEDRARQIDAAEDAARRRAYPPAPTPTPTNASEQWWTPSSVAEENEFMRMTGGEFDLDFCGSSGRSGGSGRFPRQVLHVIPTGMSGTSGTRRPRRRNRIVQETTKTDKRDGDKT